MAKVKILNPFKVMVYVEVAFPWSRECGEPLQTHIALPVVFSHTNRLSMFHGEDLSTRTTDVHDVTQTDGCYVQA